MKIFDAEDLFAHIEGNPDDVIDTPNETKDYTITIEYKKNPRRTITGSYDKNGLPEDFVDFAETVFDFIRFYGLGEILDPSVYGKAKRRKSEYIFCSVIFDEGYKSYYYLTEDDSIEIGDFALVPAGKDNHEAVVEVVNIEYFDEENVPLPVEKTKRIIESVQTRILICCKTKNSLSAKKATYQEIKDYVLKEFGLKVSNLYISQIKRKCGIEVGENYNLPKTENPKMPQCPKEKEDAIKAALKYYAMI